MDLASALANYRDGVLDSLRVLEEMDPAMAQSLLTELRAREVQQAMGTTARELVEPAWPNNGCVEVEEIFAAHAISALNSAQALSALAEQLSTVGGGRSSFNGFTDGFTIVGGDFVNTNTETRMVPVTMIPRAKPMAAPKRTVRLTSSQSPPEWIRGPGIDQAVGLTMPIRLNDWTETYHMRCMQDQTALHPEKGSWPYGWTVGGCVTACGVYPHQVNWADFMTMVRFLEDVNQAIATDFSTTEEGAACYTCHLRGVNGAYQFGVTTTPMYLGTPELQRLGTRMYFEGLARAYYHTYETASMLLTLAERFGRHDQ